MASKLWTEDELILALALYLRTPYGRISERNPDVQALAARLNRTAGSVAFKLANLARFDRIVADEGKKGFSNGSKLDKVVWIRFVGDGYDRSVDLLLDEAEKAALRLDVPGSLIFPEEKPAGDTETRVTVRARRHQDYFRRMVLQRYRGVCLVTGLRCRSLLEVAHIVPWSENKSLRLVPSNGLTLNPLIHRAYDANLLGIDPHFTIHVSKHLLRSTPEGSLRDLFTHLDNRRLLQPAKAMPDPVLLEKHYEDFLAEKIVI